MKFIKTCTISLLACLHFACNSTTELPHPRPFLPGLVSTGAVEYAIAFSPSGDSCFFVRHDGQWGKQNNPPASIFLITREAGSWSSPRLASFSNPESNDGDVFVAPDGKSIFFVSNRDYLSKTGKGGDIWKLVFQNGEWSEPKPLPGPINTAGMEASPVVDAAGNLYFTSIRENGAGQGDIYFSEIQTDGHYAGPEILVGVSSEHGEWNVYVEPGGRWMLFEASGRPQGVSSYGDFYFSEKKGSTWEEPIHVSVLNTTGSQLNARLGDRGQNLYYAGSETQEATDVDIWVVPMESLLQELQK